MTEKKLDPSTIISQLEQMEQGVIHIAMLAAAYREALIENKVPAELANSMAADFARVWWTNATSSGKD